MKTEPPTTRAAEGAAPPHRRGSRSPIPPGPVPSDITPGPVEIDVRPGEPPEHLFRRLLGAYLAGAQRIRVRESPAIAPTTRTVVRTFCRRTDGPEIEEEGRSHLHLVDRTAIGPGRLELRLARMGRRVVRFHQDAVAGWSGLPLGEDGSWAERDDEIDREAWYLERQAALRVGVGGDPLGLWVVARSLERIADHAVLLGEAGRRLAGLPQGVAPLETLGQYHRQAMDHLEGVLRAADEAAANDLLDTGEALLASGRAISDRLLPVVPGGPLSPAAAAAMARILESIGRTIAYAQDIAQVVLDRSANPRPEAVARGVRSDWVPAV